VIPAALGSAHGERTSREQSQKMQLAAFKQRTASKVRDLRCPVHGQAPRLRFEGATLREINIQMSGCCDQLIGLANQRILQLHP
jgi:hypothetical protein